MTFGWEIIFCQSKFQEGVTWFSFHLHHRRRWSKIGPAELIQLRLSCLMLLERGCKFFFLFYNYRPPMRWHRRSSCNSSNEDYMKNKSIWWFFSINFDSFQFVGKIHHHWMLSFLLPVNNYTLITSIKTVMASDEEDLFAVADPELLSEFVQPSTTEDFPGDSGRTELKRRW